MENDAEPQGEGMLVESPSDNAIPLARPAAWTPAPNNAFEIHLMAESRSAAWGDILLFLFLFVSLDIGGEFLMVSVYHGWSGTAADTGAGSDLRAEKALLIPSLVWRAALAVTVIGCIVRRRGGSARSVGVTSGNLPLDFLIAIGTALAAGLVISIVILTLSFFFPAVYTQLQNNSQRIMDRVPRISPAVIALVTLLVGFWEELVFRGFLMPRLRRATGSWAIAVLLSTAVFAALHMIDQVPAALVLVTVLSLTLSLVTIWRRSIVPAVVAHALLDFAMFLQLYYLAGDQWK
ncbi:MAG: type II CAAX endopeptidase family protein [Phycisphaerales bacterium]|nr:type II CAAX endopeptidase family protein [Phycisphaerales bacterium]